ncbi:MAG: hypothetical protein ACYDBV_07335 [Nitrospiria bacterium]
MTPSVGRQLVNIISWPFFLSTLIFGATGLIYPQKSLALLNGALTGSIETAYLNEDMDQGGIKSSSQGIEQRYNLKYSQNLLDPRLGYFSSGISYVDDQTSFSGPADQARRYILKDYNINLSLLPMISPVTFFAQKTERENQFDMTIHDTISTYGFAWNYAPSYLPRLGVNASHTTYSSDLLGLFPTTDTDFLTLETGGLWRGYNISARYLYNQTKGAAEGNSWSHGINLNLNGAITQALTLGAYANYATQGGTASGMNFFQENDLGLNLFYLPSKYWDGNLRFDFNQAPGPVNFQRYLMSGGLNFHPTGNLDILNSGQYTRFETGASRTDSIFANSALNWRPFFGLTLAGSLGAGVTKITGGGISSTSKQGLANWSATYFKTLTLLRINGGYAGNVAQNDSNLLGRSTDTTHAFSLGVDNTQTEYIHVGVNGSLTQIYRTVPSQSDDQKETRLSATADSHYFRNLVFYNDSMLLDGTLTYLDVAGFGTVSGPTVSEDFHATYQFLNMFTLLGAYSHIAYPEGFYGGNANIASLDFMGTLSPWENGLWTFSLKDLVDQREDQYNQTTLDAQTKLSHQLGLLTLSTEYNYLKNDAGPMTTTSQQFLVRAIRPF